MWIEANNVLADNREGVMIEFPAGLMHVKDKTYAGLKRKVKPPKAAE